MKLPGLNKQILIAIALSLSGCLSPTSKNHDASKPDPLSINTADDYRFFLRLSEWIMELKYIGYQQLEAMNDLAPGCKLLVANLGALHCGLDPGIIFVNETVFVPKQKDNVPYLTFRDSEEETNMMFITGPVSSLRGEHLVFLASTHPNHMSILTINTNMQCGLVYDSWGKSDLWPDTNSCLDPIGDVRWISDNEFLMTERKDLSSQRCETGIVSKLTVSTNGAFSITYQRPAYVPDPAVTTK
jgi:hypothetical protein